MTRHKRDDWRVRMAVRGGPVSHALARLGWLVFAVLGVLAMIGVAVLYTSDPGEYGSDNSPAANFLAGVIVFTPIGAVLGALIGLPVQFAARSWLRNPTEAERRAARAAYLEETAPRLPEHGLQPHGRWARFYEACARSVATYHDVVATVPEGAGRDWLTNIGATLDEQLAEALRLAQLGESLEPGNHGTPGETAYRVLERLRVAKKSFDDTTERAASIALDLQKDSDFLRLRAQLDMLAEQAPNLRED